MSTWVLQDNEIHFWYYSVDLANSRFEELLSYLTPQEKNQSDQFYFEEDKIRFIIFRAFLREVLGEYLNQDPKQISFSINRFGKPHVVFSSLFFNLSHSKDFCLIGISKNLEIGVDLEVIRDDRSYEKIAEKYFSSDENKYYLNHSSEKIKRFYQIWTCKEAFLKGVSEGFHFPLQETHLKIQENPFSVQLSFSPSFQRFSSWSIQPLSPPLKNLVATFAVQSPIEKVKYIERVWKD